MLKLISQILIFIASTAAAFAPYSVFAQTQSDAEMAASQFLQRFDGAVAPSTIYDAQMSANFKSNLTRQKFSENIGMMRIQMGGGSSSRQLMGSQSLSQLQGVASAGPFYYFRYVSNYPVARFGQDVTLEREGNSWKVVGFYFFVLPQSQ